MKKIFVIIILLLSIPVFSQVSEKENAQKVVEAVKHLFPQWQELEFKFDEVKESVIPGYLQARFYVTHQDKKVPMVIYFSHDGKYGFVGQLINIEKNTSLTNEFAGEIKYDTVDMSTLNLKNAARKGDLNAPVTIIEYSDFQCPYCKRAESVTKQICEEYKDKIAFIYKHIPWPKHKYSVKLAVAAECARAQDEQAFWNFHDVFFTDEFKITDDKDLMSKVMDIAGKNKLNIELFKSCCENNKTENIVNDHFNESKFLGISSTPTFVINGERILGALPYQNFQDIIEKKLAELKK